MQGLRTLHGGMGQKAAYVLSLCDLIDKKDQRSKVKDEKNRDKRIKNLSYFVEHTSVITAWKRDDQLCAYIVAL